MLLAIRQQKSSWVIYVCTVHCVWIVLVALSRIFLQIFSRVRAFAVDLLFILFDVFESASLT